MPEKQKHILVLIKFHPERELRLIQEYCKDGYSYEIIAQSYRVAADWSAQLKDNSIPPAKKVWIVPELVKRRMASGTSLDEQPALSKEVFEKAVLVDKKLKRFHDPGKIKRFLNCYLHFIHEVLDVHCYSQIIGEISSAFELLLYRKAQEARVPYAYFIASPITPNTLFFIDDHYSIRRLPEFYEEEKVWVGSSVGYTADNPKIPGYMQFTNQTKLGNLLKVNKLKQNRRSRLANLLKTYRADAMYSADFVPGFNFYVGRMMRWYRFFILKMIGRYLWQKKVEKGQYVLFLQFEPEITTSLYAYPFKSQRQWIETVLEHLEEGRKLYVKEHPAMFSQRNFSFYLFLRRQKGVQLVDPTVPSKEIIRDARAVMTLNSTVGIESLKAGTPVISFGRAYFNFVPEVLKWAEVSAGKGWKTWGQLALPQAEALKKSYTILERAIKRIEYPGCLNDHRLDSYVMSAENMASVKKAIEQYVEQD
ncbi:MAG TPA: hypothetical protein VHK69_12355 [Chitinophagaceae bacterium]|jgi:hypothetical protein|nr:hypothetical protein [Chitinophagaceae bacterium]